MDGRVFGLVTRKTLVILDRSRKKKRIPTKKGDCSLDKAKANPRRQTVIPAAKDGDLSPSAEQGKSHPSDMANPHEPHFFKPLLPGCHSGVTISLAFFLKHIEGKTNQKTWKLRSDASDQTWEVIQEGRTLTGGWKDFTTAHDLRIGDLVIFKHEGDMVFHVTPFGPSCCEIQYTHPHIIKEEADAGDADDNEISKSQ
uniref:TF-B3 domain-containing protein n=1 Tax=Brassica campestris TaxID=3711 RepID=M4F8U5_BRACM